MSEKSDLKFSEIILPSGKLFSFGIESEFDYNAKDIEFIKNMLDLFHNHSVKQSEIETSSNKDK